MNMNLFESDENFDAREWLEAHSRNILCRDTEEIILWHGGIRTYPSLYNRIIDKIMLDDVGMDDCWLWKKHNRVRPATPWVVYHQQTFPASHLIYEEFVGDIPENHLIMHKCNNPRCVNPMHLICGIRDDLNEKVGSPGIKNGNSALNMQQLNTIRHLIKQGVPNREIAKQIGTSYDIVYRIKTGRCYKEN